MFLARHGVHFVLQQAQRAAAVGAAPALGQAQVHPGMALAQLHLEGGDVGEAQQFFHRRHLARVAQGELHFNVIEQHLHAERFREQPHLRADVAVADNAERLAPHLVRARRGFDPAAAVGGGVAQGDAAQQQDVVAHEAQAASHEGDESPRSSRLRRRFGDEFWGFWMLGGAALLGPAAALRSGGHCGRRRRAPHRRRRSHRRRPS